VAASEALPAPRFIGHVIVANSYAAMNVWDVVESISTKHISTQSLPITKYQSDKLTISLVMFEAGDCEQLERGRPDCSYSYRIIDRSRQTPARLACVPESDQLPSPCDCRPFLLWSTSFSSLDTSYLVVYKSSRLTG
jgi:hypothetical protein